MRFKKTIASLFIAGSAIGLGAACESVSEDPPKPQGQEQQTPQRGVGSKDASKDVKLGEPELDPYGMVTVPATITNHSSKASDYMLEANVYDGSGAQVSTAMGFAWNVAPGGKAKVTLDSAVDMSVQSVTVKLTTVERTASY